MTVLVTGGAGYIGSHMVLALIEAGRKVVVLDNLTTGFESSIPKGVELVVGDVSDETLIKKIVTEAGIRAVAHFAASIVVPESVKDPLKYYKNNTAQTLNLVSACVESGVEDFLFSSTAAVYGTPETALVTESSKTKPESPYGSSKLMSEQILRDVAAAYGLRVGILRYFNVAGADPAGRVGQSFPGATHLIKMCVQAALGRRDRVNVFGMDYPTKDGTGVRDYIHVSDLVAAHVLGLHYLETAKKSFVLNCGYGQGYSVLEVINAVKRVSGTDFVVSHEPRREGDAAEVVASSETIRALLNWRPKYENLDLIVRDALRWERKIMNKKE